MTDKKYTFKDRFFFTLNYIKNFMFIITPLTLFLGYIGTLVVKDTEVYKRVNAVVEWYEEKSNSFAVGIRVNKIINEETGKVKFQTVYKATDGNTYPAVYSPDFGYWFYMDETGKRMECH